MVQFPSTMAVITRLFTMAAFGPIFRDLWITTRWSMIDGRRSVDRVGKRHSGGLHCAKMSYRVWAVSCTLLLANVWIWWTFSWKFVGKLVCSFGDLYIMILCGLSLVNMRMWVSCWVSGGLQFCVHFCWRMSEVSGFFVMKNRRKVYLFIREFVY